jgi:hypothetical protein
LVVGIVHSASTLAGDVCKGFVNVYERFQTTSWRTMCGLWKGRQGSTASKVCQYVQRRCMKIWIANLAAIISKRFRFCTRPY